MITTNRVVLNEKEHDLSMLIDINIRAVIAICFPRVIGSPADTRRPRDVEIRSQRGLIYDVLKMSVKRLFINVKATYNFKKVTFLSCTVWIIQKFGMFLLRFVSRYEILTIIKILEPHFLANFTESEALLLEGVVESNLRTME